MEGDEIVRCEEGRNSFECWLYNQDFVQNLISFRQSFINGADIVADKIDSSFGNAFRRLFNETYFGKTVTFIWDIISFLLYGVRSIILLIWNLIYSILNGFVQMFTQLLGTFTDLSVFMGSTTTILVSMFTLVLLILGFQFLLRFFTGKYHYKRVSK